MKWKLYVSVNNEQVGAEEEEKKRKTTTLKTLDVVQLSTLGRNPFTCFGYRYLCINILCKHKARVRKTRIGKGEKAQLVYWALLALYLEIFLGNLSYPNWDAGKCKVCIV